jgi:dihydroflavonol-4-reductase
MTQSKRVVITGGNGHVGYNLARLLKERGYQVRATVRDANDTVKTKALRDLGLELVSADLMQPETLAPAMVGMDGLFQVAAVYRTHARDPEKEIVEPSVVGGLNALKAAHAAGVKKVVFTSSVAAIGSNAPSGRPLNEEDWNDGAVSPYFRAKTGAERKAWAFAKETGLKLVVINPGAIIGPGFFRHTPSTVMFEQVIRGQLPFALPTGFTFVDVRDVASAHLLAYERDDANGRYLACDRYFSMPELMRFLHELDPALRVPSMVLPKAFLPMIPPMDWLQHKVLGTPRQITRAMVSELGGHYQNASGDRLRKELGWTTIDFKQSVRDTLDWIRRTFMARTKANGGS